MRRRLKGLADELARAFAGSAGRSPEEMPSATVLLSLFLGTLVVSILLPIVLNLVVSEKLSGLDQFMLGVGIYVALTLTTQAYHLRRLDANTTKDRDLWRVNDVFDRRLANIRQSFSDLTKNRRTEPEFFSMYFERSLEIFEETIHEAASNCELLVDENHLSTTDMLLKSFAGRETDVARFVHYFEDNEWMFDTWAKNYCVRLWELVESRQLKEVKRLFIYRNSEEELLEQSQKLMDFHGANEHYDYRVLSEERYKNIVRDFHMRESFKDFGIYGDWYVYRTLAASPEHIEGVFSSLERKVKEYQSLFDRCWDDAPIPSETQSKRITPTQLFGEVISAVSAAPKEAVPPASHEQPSGELAPESLEELNPTQREKP